MKPVHPRTNIRHAFDLRPSSHFQPSAEIIHAKVIRECDIMAGQQAC
jgi:hypothetical protein